MRYCWLLFRCFRCRSQAHAPSCNLRGRSKITWTSLDLSGSITNYEPNTLTHQACKYHRQRIIMILRSAKHLAYLPNNKPAWCLTTKWKSSGEIKYSCIPSKTNKKVWEISHRINVEKETSKWTNEFQMKYYFWWYNFK